MGSYRKHAVGKSARVAHKKRDQKAKRKLRAAGGVLNPFGYQDARGKSPKQLSARMGAVR